MSDKSIILIDSVAAGGSETFQTPAIGSGKTWALKTFGAADINMGDSKSSVYVLMFGSDILRIISVTGNTKELDIKKDITGDGTKRLKIIRYNKSGYDKQCPCWVSGYQRI